MPVDLWFCKTSFTSIVCQISKHIKEQGKSWYIHLLFKWCLKHKTKGEVIEYLEKHGKISLYVLNGVELKWSESPRSFPFVKIIPEQFSLKT